MRKIISHFKIKHRLNEAGKGKGSAQHSEMHNHWPSIEFACFPAHANAVPESTNWLARLAVWVSSGHCATTNMHCSVLDKARVHRPAHLSPSFTLVMCSLERHAASCGRLSIYHWKSRVSMIKIESLTHFTFRKRKRRFHKESLCVNWTDKELNNRVLPEHHDQKSNVL